MLGCIAALLLLVIASWLLFIRDSGPIPRRYARGLDFTLYYPTTLPQGYGVDRQSFKRQGNVLIFSIFAPQNRNIAVSQQAIPLDMPVRQTTTTPLQIPGQKQFSSAIGTVHIGLWGDKYVTDIVSEQTWIILNTTGFTANEATSIARSFNRAD